MKTGLEDLYHVQGQQRSDGVWVAVCYTKPTVAAAEEEFILWLHDTGKEVETYYTDFRMIKVTREIIPSVRTIWGANFTRFLQKGQDC